VRAVRLALVAAVVLLGLAGTAHAYPQYQISQDLTCTSCHLSPAGGGLLTENGHGVAERLSQWKQAPEFMYGAVETPDWLQLGGDIRAMAGYMQTPQRYLIGFPMQVDGYAHATKGPFSAQLTLGFRPSQVGNEALTTIWAREHYVMWQSNPGEREGQWIRAGHFMPVFGLRLVEHPAYTRRFGGTPLFGEKYGVSFSMIDEKWEAHVSGFLKDPFIDEVMPANGAAAYGEYRIGQHSQVGGGVMFKQSDWDQYRHYAVTAKHYLPTPGLLLQAEGQYITYGVEGSKDWYTDRFVGYLMASYQATDAVLVDLGLGYYDVNRKIKEVDRECIELNVHWFLTSHLVAVLVTRMESIGWTRGGPGSGWAFGQLHYRL
jgi:hypothetical protein